MPATSAATLSTGIEALDAELPGGGWPHRALTEILTAQPSVLEWRLLAPALRVVAAQGRPIVLIAPPKTPHLPGLEQEGIDDRQVVWIRADPPAQRLWCMEQILKASDCGAVVSWLAGARPEHLRRLQVFASNFNAPAFVLRGIQARHETSAAPLRVIVEPGADWALKASVFKRRGPVHDDELSFAAIPRSLDPILTPRLRRPSRSSHRTQPRTGTSPCHGERSSIRNPARPYRRLTKPLRALRPGRFNSRLGSSCSSMPC